MVYGGKVLDHFDRRILLAYLDEYLGDFLFDTTFQPFHFYKGNAHANYTIPYAAKSKTDFLGKFFFYSHSQKKFLFDLHSTCVVTYFYL